MIKDRSYEEVVQNMVAFLKSSNMGYNADVKIGSVIRELMIDPQAFELSILYNNLQGVQKSQSIVYASEMSTEEMDDLVSNWYLERKPGGYAQGYVMFYVKTRPTQEPGLTIPAGTKISGSMVTNKTKLVFVTTKTAYIKVKSSYSDYAFDESSVDGFFDNDLGVYGVMVYVEAVVSGPNSNMEPGLIHTIDTQLGGGVSVINKVKIGGGTNIETNEQLASRQQQALRGVSRTTQDGYEARIKQNVSEVLDVLTVSAGNSKMLRDGGYGGKADFYIMGRPFNTEEKQEIVTKVITDSNLFGIDIVLKYQPVYEIKSIELMINGISSGIFLKASSLANFNGTTYGDYQLVKDADVYGGSIYGNDRLQFLSPVGTRANESLGVIYTVNRTIVDVQNQLEVNRDLTNDVLGKEAIQKNFRVACSIDVYEGFNISEIKQGIIDDTVNFFTNTRLGALVQQSDVVGLIKDQDGVDNIIIPLDKFMFASDEITPSKDTQFIMRTIGDTGVVLSKQPVFDINSVEWRNVDGSWVSFKQKGDVVYVQSEYVLYNQYNQKVRQDITKTDPLNSDYPANKASEFYLTKAMIRSKDGNKAVPFDIIVEGTGCKIIGIMDNVQVVDSETNTTVEVAKITFNYPPRSEELYNTLRVSYYYEQNLQDDYELVKDVGTNADTFNAQDKLVWLSEVDLSKGDLPVRINYQYNKLNGGDVQLDVNQFVSIDSKSIDIRVRKIVPLPKDVSRRGGVSQNDLFDI